MERRGERGLRGGEMMFSRINHESQRVIQVMAG
jgi:hypothetical protein